MIVEPRLISSSACMTNVSITAPAADVWVADVHARFVVDWCEPLVPAEAPTAEVAGVDTRWWDC